MSSSGQPTVVNVEQGKSVLYFTAAFCGPCQRIKPIFENLNHQHGNKIKFYKMEIGENQEIADQLNVTTVPTFFFIKEGQIKDTFSGANEALLKSHVAKLLAL